MIWLNPNCDVICSILLPSKLVWSFAHQFLDFALKSPIATKRKASFCARLSKFFQNFYKIFQKPVDTDLVTYREQQNYICGPQSSIQILYSHLKVLYWEPVTVDMF